MARVVYPHTNFTSGELTPRVRGRVDIPYYPNGAEIIENAVCLVHGGAVRRPGWRFVAATKDHSKRSILVPFVFSRTQSYMVEFGAGYCRFLTSEGELILSGGVPYEIATPYTEEMLEELDYCQRGDAMIVFHEAVYPQRLQRVADDLWTFGDVPFVQEPVAEQGLKPATTLTLSSADVGTGRTLTAGASTFQPSDVGRMLYAGGGIAVVTGYTSGTVVTASITRAFPSTSLAAGAWLLDGSPVATLTPSAKEPVGANIRLTLTVEDLGPEVAISDITRSSSTVTVDATAHGLSVGDSVRIANVVPTEYNGVFEVKTVPSANEFTVQISTTPGPATSMGIVRSVAFSAGSGWRAGDVGKLVRLNGGLVQITDVSSGTEAQGVILKAMVSAVGAEPFSWTLESKVWGPENGYPRTGTIFEQRLWMAGSPAYPLTIWGSVLREYFDFLEGDLATDAVSFTVGADVFDPIVRLTSVKSLVALTTGAEYTIGAGSDTALGPTNPPRIVQQSNYGSSQVRPVRVANELMFVQAGRRRLRALSPDPYDQREYGAYDLSALAEHITKVGIAGACYQSEPEPMLSIVRDDGVEAVMSVDREQGVIALGRNPGQGAVEWVAVLPTAEGQVKWAVIRRTIGGETRRYIEISDWSLNTDCAITGTSEAGAATWTDLGHLELETVQVVADGVDMGDFTVSGAQITLPRTAHEVEIGLGYTTRIKLLPPEIGTNAGSSQGVAMSVNEVTVRLLDSIGGSLSGAALKPRRLAPVVLDSPVQPFTGDVTLSQLGWARGKTSIEIVQDRPLPLHVLGVFYKITVNEG